ncbi:MAG TPA: IS4 family transposase, partial [Pirellulaceae bacterium]|nr:IS4 family transposase [Pirellulaceae bacterium]
MQPIDPTEPIHSIQGFLRKPGITAVVRTLLGEPSLKTRTQLGRELCQRCNLRDPRGNLRVGTAVKALRNLESQGFWSLPAPTQAAPRTWRAQRLDHPVPVPEGLPAQAGQLQGLRLVLVCSLEQRRMWNELIIREHPLHDARLVGRQLRYLIESSQGCLGALGFGSAALFLEGRDKWIGWNEPQHREHLPRVLNMSRFLIRPEVHVKNLASRVLALCTAQVAGDFERLYHYRPWLLESFVDTSLYEGTCYKAANWICVGQSKGRGRNGGKRPQKSLKDIYLYALLNDLHARMGVELPRLEALEAASGLEAAQWAQQEFGACELGDARRTARLVDIVHKQSAQPSASYSQATGGCRYELKNYYRFLNSAEELLGSGTLLQSHRSNTIRRMASQPVALVVQDTMKVNLSTREACDGLGQIGTNQTGTRSLGLHLHSSLAIGGDDNALPLGVLNFHGYAPEPAKGKDARRPIEEKQSRRWIEGYEDACTIAAMIPHTEVISVAEREAGMFELFEVWRRKEGPKAGLLIRSSQNRCLEDSGRKLFEEMAGAPLASTIGIGVPRQRAQGKKEKPSGGGRPGLRARTANVELRFQKVVLQAPKRGQSRHKEPIELWAIYLVEPNPPKGATPVKWLLLTTVKLTSLKEAIRCVRMYCRR